MTGLQPKAAFVAAVVVLAIPAGASAATKVVDMGLPTAQQKAFQKQSADVNDFFPHGTTIHVGDSIRFVPTGFHTVDLPARGGKPHGVVVPAGTTSGVVDAAGAAFWFNGQPMLGFNPALVRGSFGKKLAYTGAKRVESGVPLSQHPKPFTVRFTKRINERNDSNDTQAVKPSDDEEGLRCAARAGREQIQGPDRAAEADRGHPRGRVDRPAPPAPGARDGHPAALGHPRPAGQEAPTLEDLARPCQVASTAIAAGRGGIYVLNQRKRFRGWPELMAALERVTSTSRDERDRPANDERSRG